MIITFIEIGSLLTNGGVIVMYIIEKFDTGQTNQ